MTSWGIHVPKLVEQWETEDEDREIIQYLRHGGTLFGDCLGEIEGFQRPTKPYRKPPEQPTPEPKPQDTYAQYLHKVQWEIYGPWIPEYRIHRCLNCNRSMPYYNDPNATCSKECEDALERFRTNLLIRFGMKT